MNKIYLTFSIILISITVFAQNLTPVTNTKGLYGFIDENNDTVIKCQFEYAEDFSHGLALIKSNMRFKIIDTTGTFREFEEVTESGEIRYDLGSGHSGLPLIIRVWDCHYINLIGEKTLELPYSNAFSFENGVAKVIDGDKLNYINRNGILMDEWKFIPDNYKPIKYKEKYGYIDRDGKLAIEYQYTDAKDFKDEFAQVSNGTYWALIDKTGRKISDWYEEISEFDGEIAMVKKLENTGFINNTGKFVGKWYSKVEPVGYGLYKVFKYEKWAIVNQQGIIVTSWFDEVYPFDGQFLKVKKDDKYAYLNKMGGLAISWYDKIFPEKEGIIIVLNEGKYRFYNVNTFFISEEFEYLSNFFEGLAVVKQNEKYGFIDKVGNIVFGFEYDNAKPFKDGLAVVEKGDKVGYMQRNGELLIGWRNKLEYFSSTPPQGIIAVKFGTKYGYQTINGKRVISAKYEYADNFKESVALVKNNFRYMLIDKEGNLKELDSYPKDSLTLRLDWGNGHTEEPIKIGVWDCEFIDFEGRTILELPYSDAYSFNNNKAKVINGDKFNYIDHEGNLLGEWKELPDEYNAVIKDRRFGFINKNNELVIDYQFHFAEDFVKGIAKIRKGKRTTGKYAIINKKGELISELYDEIFEIENSYIKVRNGEKYGIIDTSGALLTDEWYDDIKKFSENYAVVKNNNKYAYINRLGKRKTEWFLDAYSFSNKRAKVLDKNGWGYINYKGELTIPTIYEQVWDFENNVAKVSKDNKYAFIDIKGEIITDWYDRMFGFSDAMAVVCLDRKWGYIDINGELAIECKYQRAFAFSDGIGIVFIDGERQKINKKGEFLKN